MRKIYFVALFVLMMTLLPFQKAFALSCVQPPPPEIAFHEYDVVVIGTVTKIKDTIFLGYGYDLGKGAVVEADVSLSLKGYNSNKITFSEDLHWGESQVGTEYLLFLNKKGDGFESPLCSPTTETAGLDMDTLVENLTAEATSTGNETNVYTPGDSDSDKTDESKNNWLFLISIITILFGIAAVIFYRKGKS